MYEDDDKRFFDELYQMWSKTTGAGDSFWMPEEDVPFSGQFQIRVVGEDGPGALVAAFLKDEDADFITAMHGALPELIRRLHDATDEAVRLDEARDMAEGRLAEALMENIGLPGVQILDLDGPDWDLIDGDEDFEEDDDFDS